MFANWQRRRLRAQFTPLINRELPDAEAARVQSAIDADPVLAAELRRLQTALDSLRTFDDAPLPTHFRASLSAELDLLDQPLRERYSDLLDDALPDAEAAELRRAIEAAPVLAGEFAFLAKVVDVCHALPDEPLPIGFAHSLARQLDAVDAERAPVTRPAPVLAPRRNLAFAGVLTVVLGCGWLATKYAPSQSQLAPAPVASRPAPEPEAVTPEPLGEAPMGQPVAVAKTPTDKPAEVAKPVVAVAPVTHERRRVAHVERHPRRSRVQVASEPDRVPPAATEALGKKVFDALKNPVVKPDARTAFAPTTAPPKGASTPKPERPDREPLSGVRIKHPTTDSEPRMAAPSREIPSPNLLNRRGGDKVALEFATASFSEATLPRATLPDLDFGGVD